MNLLIINKNPLQTKERAVFVLNFWVCLTPKQLSPQLDRIAMMTCVENRNFHIEFNLTDCAMFVNSFRLTPHPPSSLFHHATL